MVCIIIIIICDAALQGRSVQFGQDSAHLHTQFIDNNIPPVSRFY